MIEFVRGDLFEQPAQIRVNTVNCVGVMGAGVALAFKQRYPEMYRDYARACRHGDIRPGEIHVWRPLGEDWIINFPTKRDWREPSRIEDIEAGLDALKRYLEPLGAVTVALPALGCGHGGLDWEQVSQLIKSKLNGLEAHFYVFEPAASLNAGRKNGSVSADDILSAEKLGFRYLPPNRDSTSLARYGRFVKGPATRLDEPWIAILPSRQPSDREIGALQSLATQLCAVTPSPVLALIHHNKASEAMARLFAEVGLTVVLIDPAGVLTRKPSKTIGTDKSVRGITTLSIALPTEKWDRQLLRKAHEIHRSNAAAMLISDPHPEWLLKGRNGAQNLPISFLRYDGMPNPLLDALTERGAKPLARRASDKAPKLEPLLNAWQSALGKDQTPAPEGASDAVGEALSLDLSDYSEEQWIVILSLITEAHPRSVEMRILVDDDATSAALEERLERLRERRFDPPATASAAG